MSKHLEDAVNLMRALGSEARLRIMCALLDGELNVSDICERFGMSQSGVSQHLSRLRAQGLVVASRHGQFVHYALPQNTTREVVAFLDRQYGVRDKIKLVQPKAIGSGATAEGGAPRISARSGLPLHA